MRAAWSCFVLANALKAAGAMAMLCGVWRTPLAAQESARPAPKVWLSRIRLQPTLQTDRGRTRSESGFGIQVGAEWGADAGWFAIPVALELAGDNRQELACGLRTSCRSGRINSVLLTSGLVLRPWQVWRVRPFAETGVSAGFAQWTDAVAPGFLSEPLTLPRVRTGGGGVTRVSLGAGLELSWEDRLFVLGLQRGLVREARWPEARAVTTLVLGARSRF
jgi:hypothetical protein